LQVVDAVSKLLPDDTWLTQFELKTLAKGKETQRDLLVRGETANAGHLVQLFEESNMFAQAAPRSQTTKIQPGPGEIFDLGAQLKARALPPTLALAVTDAPVEAPQSLPPAASPAPGAALPMGAGPAPAMPAGTPPTPPPAAPAAVPASPPSAPTPVMRTRPADAGMQLPAGPLSPGLAPPADAGKAPASGFERKP
jgi:hypothetical protein